MRIPFLGLWVLLFLPLHSQNPHYFQFGTNDGLPSSEVYDVVLDGKGMPWFSTDRGACSYDGYTFTSYSRRDGLSSNTCLGIEVDPADNLWFIGLDGSLSIRDKAGIHPFAFNGDILRLVGIQYSVEGMAWANGDELYLVLQSIQGRKVVVGNTHTGGFKEISRDRIAAQFPTIEMHGYQFVEIGKKWIDPAKRTLSMVRRKDEVIHTGVDNPNSLYQETIGAPETFFELDLGAPIYDIFYDSEMNLWICTGNGIAHFPEGNIHRKPIGYFDGVAFCRMQQDREGNYWLSTFEKGVFLVPSFAFGRLDLGFQAGEATQVTSLAALQDHLVVGTQKGEILTVDHDLNVNRALGSLENFGELTFSFSENKRGSIGMYKLEESADQVKVDPLSEDLKGRVILELDNQDLLDGRSSGLFILAGGEQQDYSAQIPDRIQCAFESSKELWLGTLKGLWLIENNDYNHPQRVFPEEEAISGRINDIKKDHLGNLWISTIGEGLVYITEDELHRVGIKDGLSSEMVNRVAIEKPGVIWVATNQGLSRVAYKGENGFEVLQVNALTVEEGLPDNYVLDIALWQDEIWLGTNGGIVHFKPGMLEKEALPTVPVFLEEVAVNRDPVAIEKVVELANWQNDLSFRFLGISMRKPIGQPFYRYRMLGASESWEYSSDRTARYLNLAPGSYTFEVEAQNRNGQWSRQPAQYAFTIQPHFSQTLWFQSLVVLILICIIAIVFYLRLRQLRTKQKQERKLQEARLKAQEAEITVLRNQMNPHFVFNALNSIQNFIFENDVPQANYYLSRFAQLFRDVLHFSRQSWIPLEQELDFLNAYLELESMRFPERFTYNIEVDEKLDPQEVSLPPFLFQPMLENSIKHGFKNIEYRGQLTISFHSEGDGWLRGTVQDNGSGILAGETQNAKPYHRSMGLKIVTDRIELLNAERKGRQAEFELITRNQNGEQGTTARFLLPIQGFTYDESDNS